MQRAILSVIALIALPCVGTARAELIAHYKFDDNAGNSASDSASTNHATWVPGTLPSPDWQPAGGLLGGAVRFPGSGTHVNYFEIASLPAINGTPAGMSIAVWFKPAGNSGYRGILMSRDVDGGLFGFGHDGDHLDGRVDAASVDSPDGTLAATGDWFHVAWVWDNVAHEQQLYINGTPSGPVPGVAAQTITANSDWRIGDDECCNDRNLDGWLDDLAIYDEALSPAEVAALYSKGLAGYSADESPPPPVTDPLDVGLVINEVHYDADPKTQRVEFVELLNTGPVPLDLSGFRFSRGIDFVFPPGTLLGVTEYLVVGEDPVGAYHYTGALSNEGDTIELIDATGAVVDRVNYGTEFPWPIIDDGSSMQLVNATLDNDLGGSWRPGFPTPGLPNGVFASNAAPQLRQVGHSPKQPTSAEATTVSVKASDPDGVGSLTLHYQIVAPGSYIPAYLALPSSTVNSNPFTPRQANPAFEDPANWVDVAMTAVGDIYSAGIPAQQHRTLIRYRITASDTLGNTIRAPFPEDPSLNFATFCYDGVPGYTADTDSVHPDGVGHTYPAALLTTIPVYHLITDPDDFAQCWAYNSSDRMGSVAARKVFNWEGAMVYDGVTYDHIAYRLRQRNDRYAGQGRRSMRFRFRRGNYFQARDPEGEKYPVKWRSMNTGKMSRFAEAANHGMRELVSSRLWNIAGVTAPEFQHVHFRVIDGAAEQPDQYHGDFYGMAMIFEDVDAQFLEDRDLPRGNVYKLKDGESNPLELQKYQARDAVNDGSDFINIRDNLGPPTQSDAWLRDHVDWDSWYLYAALGEGFRHYDFAPYHQKNRIWYFKPDPTTPFGLMSIIPHDTDATWKRGTNDNQWDDPRYGPGPGTQRGRVVGIDLPKEAIQEITGLDGTDGENHPERAAFMLEYRNVIREVRQLFWQPETVNAVIDDAYDKIAAFSLADRDRWDKGPADAGNENIGPLEDQVALMKGLAFTEDLYMGSSLAGGRAQWLSNLAADAAIPEQPVISYSGAAGFPAGGLEFTSSAFADPQGAGSYALTQWRIAEVAPAPDRKFEWDAVWLGEGAAATVAPPAVATRAGGTYRARVRHADDSGRWSEWSEPLEFTATQPDISLFTSSLVISEIMYHPSDPSAAEISAGYVDDDFFEYVEVRNVGTQTIDLSDVRFTKGVDFDFAGSAVTSLAPGEFVLVVEHEAAFDMRYGVGKPVAGVWSGKLDNGGEQLKLSYGAGEAIRDFIYDDMPDWPTSPDGSGPSLVLVDPYGLPDHGDPFNWRSAAANPGVSDGTTFPGGDDAALLEYASGGSVPEIVVLPGGEVALTVGENRLAEDLTNLVEVSTDLVSWVPAGTSMSRTAVAMGSAGVAMVAYATPSAPGGLRWFVRYRVDLR